MEFQLFEICSIVIVLSALFGYINVKVLRLPNTIGLMIIAILFTVALFASTYFSDFFLKSARDLIAAIDFQHVLLEVMLGFLLFAGAMHTNFDQLRVQRWPVLVFSTLGVLASTFICATLIHFGFAWIGIETKFIECLLFGALISPTDPIAVLGILKRAGVPKKLETKIVGESLFNDGVGVVVFLTIFSIATGGNHPGVDAHADHASARNQTPIQKVVFQESADQSGEAPQNATQQPSAASQPKPEEPNSGDEHDNHAVDHEEAHDAGHAKEHWAMTVVRLFGTEVLGGLLLGLVLGYSTFILLRTIDDYEIEVMITLACVMGGYSLASALHLSAPLAIVVAGLLVGNDTVRGTAMSKQTELYVDKFWELMDILLNAILFVLIGLEILVLTFKEEYALAAGLAIAIVLLSRFLSLLLPVRFFSKKLDFVPYTATIMTWGGLRGGISIALALLLPEYLNRDLFLTVTYGVVVFSIIVQGLSVGYFARKLIGAEAIQEPSASH
jgi:CPA1 family monovalent cation:H+ antiporter